MRRQRHALVSKVVFAYPDSFWEDQGQNGCSYAEACYMGGTWPQREGMVSALVPPELFAPMPATAPGLLENEPINEAAAIFGEQARRPEAFFLCHRCIDPLTEG